MATGLPARAVVLCVLCAVGSSYAQGPVKRPVAVIDLAGDPATTKLRRDVYGVLIDHWALKTLGNPTLDAALEGSLVDENADAIAAATWHRGNAEAALEQFELKRAADEALEAQRQLAQVAPTPANLLLYADVSFAYGHALFDQHQVAEAKLAFALAYRLDPGRKLDPARYLPELRDLYEAARTFDAGTTKLAVKGTGRVVIDGNELGDAPGTFEVVAGHHLVQLVGPDRKTSGEPLHGGHTVEIPDAPLDERGKLERARLVLARSPDVTARATAMRELAALLDAHDAVLIGKQGERVVIQTWRDTEQGFSAIREYHGEKPIEILGALAPPEPPPPPKPPKIEPPKKLPIVVETPWWKKTWVRGSIAGGLALGIVGGILWAQQTGDLTFNPNVSEKPR